ncbi:MAG: methyltransferase domain-containing protein [Acidimicrobiales bacterium]
MADHPGCSLRSLARTLGSDPMNVKHCADELEHRGLLRSAHRSGDRRPRQLELTDLGREVCEQVEALVRDEESRLNAALGNEGRASLEGALSKLEAMLANLSARRRPGHQARATLGYQARATAAAWDRPYPEAGWPTEPDATLVELAGPLLPGRALDLGCGTGRNAIWLARRGWRVTGVGAPSEGLGLAAEGASQAGLPLVLVNDNPQSFQPAPGSYDLVVVADLRLAPGEREGFFARVAAAVAPGGHVYLAGRHEGSLGVAGPTGLELLYREELLAQLLPGMRLELRREERHMGDDGQILVGAVVWASAPAA